MTGAQGEIEEIVRHAISNRLRLEIEYHGKGKAQGVRIIDPHALFRTGNDRIYLHAFQVDGASSSGDIPDWRQFDLAEISIVELKKSHFGLAEGYDPSSRMYSAGLIAAAS
ncbi:MAG TPA: WYL domain-containing protein [Solirubrobacterales bacterium]|nr:WYL domain-containing protein [Solirubrobacterales bacterium]